MMAAAFGPELRLGLVEGRRLARKPVIWLPRVLTAVWAGGTKPILARDLGDLVDQVAAR